jgi:putative transposase
VFGSQTLQPERANEASPLFQQRGEIKKQQSPRQGTADALECGTMSHTYSSLLVHCIFSTKDRKPIIPQDMQSKLWAYIGGIARTNKFRALAVGGTRDHTHVLLWLPAAISVAKAVQLIKGGSSKWLNDHLPGRTFAWQDSYGAFTIGTSQIKSTIIYINNQEQHHAKKNFDVEFQMILQKHGLSEKHQPSPAGDYVDL